MKKIKIIPLFAITVLLMKASFGQETSGRGFSEIIQSYYIYKDKDIVEQTIDFVNHTSMDYESLEPILTGFFGALFPEEISTKEKFKMHVADFKNEKIKNLFASLLISNIDSLYAKVNLTPGYNDMNWSSYFATGNTKYVAKIVANVPLCNNRQDLNLFLTGASAKWSLSSNATQDKGVKDYLISIKGKDAAINEILQRDPESFKTEMVDILKKQKAAGVWN